ncbi:MAG: LOG family protein, partial [Acutalibacteraceae bacterium]|nr:LOG family protein [Acutalibacteraceae bacterium]
SKQLCRHNKPIAIYNQMGYYNELYATMEQAVKKNFIKPDCLELFKMSENLDELFCYIEAPQKQRTVKDLKEG